VSSWVPGTEDHSGAPTMAEAKASDVIVATT